MSLLQCYNKGCGQKFDPTKNADDACTYHPGDPLFHDAFKRWSCCSRGSTDFTEFLNCLGCTKGPHNPVKPEEPPKKRTVSDVEFSKPMENVACRPKRNSTESEFKYLSFNVSSELEKQLEEYTASFDSAKEKRDAEAIPIGTTCTRRGCSETYKNADSFKKVCTYHSGTPVFHEGMKYWSCCEKKTSNFDDFLNQVGCETGKHDFSVQEEHKRSKCRFDWFQTADNVHVNVYAKLINPTKTEIATSDQTLRGKVHYNNQDDIFELNIPLWAPVIPSESVVNISSTKLEIVLRKTEKFRWSDLHFDENK
ncbi:Cysteine and histidine-rich domain-containing protein 1 [Trichinella nativa]|uniref:Cysteine and histidine-rich domain-containing protein 1 n=1 Tax=Trichinella nativa TaxID=6335 RepID=A0A0V1LPX2_9BILA|nr:Cysteine and histidine-rich domain-containing protein 1 [Trichinella nativa]